MKVLAIYTTHFGYEPKVKNIENAEEVTSGATFNNCVLAFIQIEAADEEKDVLSREKKLVNHLKWVLRKNNCSTLFYTRLHTYPNQKHRKHLHFRFLTTPKNACKTPELKQPKPLLVIFSTST